MYHKIKNNEGIKNNKIKMTMNNWGDKKDFWVDIIWHKDDIIITLEPTPDEDADDGVSYDNRWISVYSKNLKVSYFHFKNTKKNIKLFTTKIYPMIKDVFFNKLSILTPELYRTDREKYDKTTVKYYEFKKKYIIPSMYERQTSIHHKIDLKKFYDVLKGDFDNYGF